MVTEQFNTQTTIVTKVNGLMDSVQAKEFTNIPMETPTQEIGNAT